MGRWLSAVLEEEKLELRQIRVTYPRDSFYSRGERTAFVSPGAIKHDVASDELYPGRQRMTLEFELPRGSYATILVKRLTIPNT
ncbi:MAG: tRNA pseudouridine(13) synthase TruD [Phycisphaerae bacterium]